MKQNTVKDSMLPLDQYLAEELIFVFKEMENCVKQNLE